MKRKGFPVVVGALALAGCGGENEEQTKTRFGENTTKVTVTLSDFRIEPPEIRLEKPGVYTFVATNNGTVNHIFEVESDDLESETPELKPGETAELTLRLRANRYKVYCPLVDHEGKGMQGTMVVGSPEPASSTSEPS
jgi:uncharacterized cupredoxin-like copper-binding protein